MDQELRQLQREFQAQKQSEQAFCAYLTALVRIHSDSIGQYESQLMPMIQQYREFLLEMLNEGINDPWNKGHHWVVMVNLVTNDFVWLVSQLVDPKYLFDRRLTLFLKIEDELDSLLADAMELNQKIIPQIIEELAQKKKQSKTSD